MDNGTDKVVVQQFDRMANLPETWDHNCYYQKYLLRYIKPCNTALDVGCGNGELARILKTKAKNVIAVDVSPEMIQTAREKNKNLGIEFLVNDVESYLSCTENKFDVITCVAALHHMDEARILQLLKNSLSGNGKIIILDLYKQATLYEYALSTLAVVLNPIIMLLKRGRFTITQVERQAWKDHARYDHYLTIQEIKTIAERILGKVTIKRHLFWRYSLIYTHQY